MPKLTQKTILKLKKKKNRLATSMEESNEILNKILISPIMIIQIPLIRFYYRNIVLWFIQKILYTRINTETFYVIAKGQNQHKYSSIRPRYVQLLYTHSKEF